MQVSDLIQKGSTLQARFVVQGRQQKYYESYTSQLFTLNDVVTFQIQVNVIIVNSTEHQILIKFAKKPEDDRNYMLKLSSKALNITNKSLKNDDGTWCTIHSTNTSRSDFDVAVVLERGCSYASYAKIIYDDDMLTDFELRCEDGSVKVHKAVLAMSSPVLRRELEGDWRETKQGYVNIPDTSRATLQHFKDYIYLHTLPDTGIEKLLLLASYYMMSELEQKCVDKLQATVTSQNTLSLLEFAVVHHMTKLQLALLDCIQSGAVKVKDLEKEVNDKCAEKLTENGK